MEKVSVIFTASDSLVGRLISFFSGSKASHVLVRHQYLGVDVCLHADVGGVQLDTRPRALMGRRVLAEFKIRQGVHLKRAVQELGSGYDYAGVLGFLVVWVARWFKRKIKNPFAGARSMFCSEFVLMLNHLDCIPEWSGLDPELTTPGDLLRLCKQGESFELVEQPDQGPPRLLTKLLAKK